MKLIENIFFKISRSKRQTPHFREYKINTPNISLKKTADAYLDIQTIKKELAKLLGDKSKKIVFGPWISEIGYETLYWVPFIRWMVQFYSLPTEKVVIISRGNTFEWYKDLCGEYYDIFDHYTLEEFKREQSTRLEQTSLQKHYEQTNFEREIVSKVMSGDRGDHCSVVYPGVMYRLFKPFWTGRLPADFVLHHTQFTIEKNHGRIPDFLPKHDYICAKFYASECFPFSEKTMNKLLSFIEALLLKHRIVFLKTNLDIDDHSEPFYQKILDLKSPNAFFIDEHLDYKNNLKVQDTIVANSKFFIGTYGGFSYLAPLYGISAHTFYSEEGVVLQKHNELLNRYIERRALDDIDYNADYHMHNIHHLCLMDFLL
jgi:hypothetical protein